MASRCRSRASSSTRSTRTSSWPSRSTSTPLRSPTTRSGRPCRRCRTATPSSSTATSPRRTRSVRRSRVSTRSTSWCRCSRAPRSSRCTRAGRIAAEGERCSGDPRAARPDDPREERPTHHVDRHDLVRRRGRQRGGGHGAAARDRLAAGPPLGRARDVVLGRCRAGRPERRAHRVVGLPDPRGRRPHGRPQQDPHDAGRHDAVHRRRGGRPARRPARPRELTPTPRELRPASCAPRAGRGTPHDRPSLGWRE
ncbi:exported hypothetical protein [Frigoribacterium sp. 9N]|nr:exported hypothetical protein [Frigoribacterium sp. 9N]